MSEQPIRVKVCFICKMYCPIIVNIYKCVQVLRKFELAHSGHETQTVNLDELGNEYNCVPELQIKGAK